MQQFTGAERRLDIRRLTKDFSVGPQIQPDDVNALQHLGFATIINVRPDAEEPGQPTGAEIQSAARAAKLGYKAIAISGRISPEAIKEFHDTVVESRGPVFAYCRSGTRAAKLWALASAPTLSVETILNAASEAGYDLSAMTDDIAARSCR